MLEVVHGTTALQGDTMRQELRHAAPDHPAVMHHMILLDEALCRPCQAAMCHTVPASGCKLQSPSCQADKDVHVGREEKGVLGAEDLSPLQFVCH
eukprot:SM001309S27057  [mRNA]  locus=s1309:1224:1508:- [translate_table: standard]